MTDYTARFKPEDLFVKETVAIYSSAIKDLSEPLIKYYAVESLLQNYVFKDELEQIEIIHFIFNNWFLMPILEECPTQSSALFDKNTNLVLELFNDPEDETDTTELFIVIRSDLNLDESLEKFDKLLADWFNTVQHVTKGLLNITIESKDEF
ncbi:hypothetical protein KAX97_11490 [candidate division WOR-3 bacterium]|nr:hypothetical protein [candidate division WOR-3 bacterium]